MKPLVPYIRQSRTRERSISVDEQRRDITRWAAAAGVPLAPEIVETNVSGNRSWRERGIGSALEAVEQGRASGIIVAWQDRLSRENGLATAEVWDALDRAGARLVCAAEGLDTATGDHELQFAIKAAIARDVWKRRRADWERTRQNAIERGVQPGPAPCGYRRGDDGRFEPDPETAPVVRAAFAARADGASWTQVAQILTDGTGKRWSLKATEKLSRNEAYRGVARSGSYRNEHAHEPLIDTATWYRVEGRSQAGKGKGHHIVGGGKRERALLSGLLICDGCGHRMVQDFNSRARFYRCRNGGACTSRAAITHARIEPFVERVAMELLGAVTFQSHGEGETAELEHALAEAEAELAAFVVHVRATTPGYAEGLAAREADVAAAAQALADAPGDESWVFLSAAETRSRYDSMTLADKRKVLGAVIERATVRRGSGPVEERVTIQPRKLVAQAMPEWLTRPIEAAA